MLSKSSCVFPLLSTPYPPRPATNTLTVRHINKDHPELEDQSNCATSSSGRSVLLTPVNGPKATGTGLQSQVLLLKLCTLAYCGGYMNLCLVCHPHLQHSAMPYMGSGAPKKGLGLRCGLEWVRGGFGVPRDHHFLSPAWSIQCSAQPCNICCASSQNEHLFIVDDSLMHYPLWVRGTTP